VWYGYFSFLEYLELRRRVENRLAKANWLAYHTAAFSIGALVTICGDIWLIVPGINHVMTLWSLLLFAQGMWTFWHSGVTDSARSQAIEMEMRHRLEDEDDDLVEDERDLFRLHDVLIEDVKYRARLVTALTVFSALNAIFWLLGTSSTGPEIADSGWKYIVLLGIYLPVLAAMVRSRAVHERRLMSHLSRTLASEEKDKPKRWGEKEKIVRLTDDGELEEVPDDDRDSSANPHPDEKSRGAMTK
jgi:hypothetical protein